MERQEAYCLWHNKFLRDVAEHESDACSDYGMYCTDCNFLISKKDDNYVEYD